MAADLPENAFQHRDDGFARGNAHCDHGTTDQPMAHVEGGTQGDGSLLISVRRSLAGA